LHHEHALVTVIFEQRRTSYPHHVGAPLVDDVDARKHAWL
jgi:hypothetical protein